MKIAKMAFHFQPSADSSDEGEVDIAAWQGSANKARPASQAPAPAAQISSTADDYDAEEQEDVTVSGFQHLATGSSAEAGAGDDEDDEAMGLSIDGKSDSPEVPSANRTPSREPTFSASGFTSINQPAPDATVESGGVGISTRQSRSRSSGPLGKGKLVPLVGLNGVDIDDYEDLTQDEQVVLRVKKELPDKKGMVRYMVELGDYTVREVRPTSVCGDATLRLSHSTLPAHASTREFAALWLLWPSYLSVRRPILARSIFPNHLTFSSVSCAKVVH